MKQFVRLSSLLALSLLAACHPTSPKSPQAPATPPSQEQPASTTSTPLTIGPAPTETASTPTTTSTPVAVEPPSAPLFGPQVTPPPAAATPPETTTASVTITPTASTPVAPTPPSAVVYPPSKSVIRVLAPEGQLNDDIRKELSAKLGIEVSVDTFASDDEALKKLNDPSSSYNVALVSYRIVSSLISNQKLAPLPQLANSLKPAPKYLHHFFDRDNAYSLPYAFSLAGIAVREDAIKKPPVQWAELFNDTFYKLTRLPDDAPFESSLLAKAGKRSATAPAKTADATDEPIQVDSIANLKKKFATQPGWKFILPGEGSVIYLYTVVIPANGQLPPDRESALITEIFNPEVTARIAEENYLGVTQPAAFKQLPAVSTADPLIYPRENILDRCIFVHSGYRPIPTPNFPAASAAPNAAQ